MSSDTYRVLLIDKQESNYRQIKQILKYTEICQIELEWVTSFDQATIADLYQNYDAYLVSSELEDYQSWVQQVNPTPVILLTNTRITAKNPLETGISHYLTYNQLNSVLLEHTLHLVISHSITQRKLEEAGRNYQALKQQQLEISKTDTESILHTIFEHINDGILIIDQDGYIRFANPATTILLNQPLQKLVNTQFGIPVVTQNTSEIQAITAQGELLVLEMSVGETRWRGELAYVVILRNITEKVNHEEALRQSEQRYRALYEKTPVMLHSIDSQGNLISVNEKWLTTLGYQRLEVIGKPSTDFLTEQSRKYAQDVVLPAYWCSGYLEDVPYQFVKKNGEILDVLLSATAEKDQTGNLIRSLAVLIDVTEKKQNEAELAQYRNNLEQLVKERTKALQESQRQYQTLANLVPVGIFRADLQGNITYINQKAQEISGLTLEQAKNNGLLQSIHPDDLSSFFEQWDQMVKLGIDFNGEFRFQRYGDGLITWVMAKAVPEFDTTGKMTGFLGHFTDISEHIFQEEKLKSSEELYRTTLAAISDAVFITDDDGNFTFICPNVDLIFGYSIEEIVKRGNIEAFLGETNCFRVEQLRTKLEITNLEQTITDSVGKTHYILVNAKRVSIQRGTILITCHDITERKQTELALQKSENRYRSLVEGLPAIIYSFSVSRGGVYYSPQVAELLGYKPEYLYENPWLWHDSVHLDDSYVLNEAIQDFIEGKSFELEYRIRDINNEWHWFYDRSLCRRLENNEIILEGLAIDITERKKTEAKLELFKRIIDTSSEAIAILYPDGKFYYVNKAFETLFLVSGNKIKNQSFGELKSPLFKEYFEQEIMPQVVKGGTWKGELEAYSSQHKQLIIWTRIDSVKDKQGRVQFCFVLMHDITKSKQAELSLKQSLKLETLLANISQKLATNKPVNIDDTLALLGETVEASRAFLSLFRQQEDKLYADKVNEWTDIDIQSTLKYSQNLELSLFPWWLKKLNNNQNLIIKDVEKLPEEAKNEKQKLQKAGVRCLISTPIYSHNGNLWGVIGFESTGNNPKQWSEQEAQLLRVIGELIYNYSERQRNQKQLLESEARYRAIVEDQNELICRFVPRGRITFVNEAFCRYFGFKREQLMGSQILSFITDSSEKSLQSYQTKWREMTPAKPNCSIKQKLIIYGKVNWQKWSFRGIFDLEGNLLEIQGLGQNITRQQEAENKLKESEALFRGIFEQAPLGIVLTEPNGKYVEVNQKFCDFLGYTKDDLLERNSQEFTHPEDLFCTFQAINSILNYRAKVKSIEIRYLCNNGIVKWGNLTCTLVTDPDQNPRYLIGIIENIQQRKEHQKALLKAKEEAEKANLAKSQFLANMSHELRTPLNVILGYAQIMNLSPDLTPSHQQFLQSINSSGEHLLTLINDILDLGKIELGKSELSRETFELYPFLESLKASLYIKATNKDLKFNFEYAPHLPKSIITDKNKLLSVLTNLLNNAIKFTKQGQVILRVSLIPPTPLTKGGDLTPPTPLTKGGDLTPPTPLTKGGDLTPPTPLTKGGDLTPPTPLTKGGLRGDRPTHSKINLYFEVEDTGLGIAEDEIDKIFQVFEQTKNGEKAGEGSGLGLAICKHFVELMGGKIEVKSTINKGTTFSFNLLCDSLEFKKTNDCNSDSMVVIGIEPNQPNYRILVVEDTASNRKLLVNLLQLIGFQVQEAHNGKEGIEKWQQWNPHLILMDLRMPIMDGYEAIKEIRRQEKMRINNQNSVVIIVLTANVLNSERDHVLQLGANDFMAKPVEQKELWAKIGKYLGVKYVQKPKHNPETIEARIKQQENLEKLTPQDLDFMSLEWKQELHRAALAARSSKVQALIEQIPSDKKAIIEPLTLILKQLRFDKIIQLTS
jgi:PAS domain S-box-containing protein